MTDSTMLLLVVEGIKGSRLAASHEDGLGLGFPAVHLERRFLRR